MVLEATFICTDNSNYMRNGDFAPSRFEAQQDAVNLLAGAKTQQNPENTVGVLSMAGKGIEVRVALTSDVGKVLSLSHGAQLSGDINLSAGIQVAQLALKHRLNKNQRQRVIVFVGSPIKEDEAMLVKLGKKLKKNSVAVDIVNFGEEVENTPKLEALLNAVNSDDNSHLVTVPPGPHVLSDILLSSPIVQSEDGGMGGAAMATGGGGGPTAEGFAEFGVDPTMDPEFAWALRVSMEEERARQEAEAKKQTEASAASESPTAEATEEGSPSAEVTDGQGTSDESMPDAVSAPAVSAELDEAALLEAAIAMSMPGDAAAGMITPAAAPPPVTPAAPEHPAAPKAVEEPTPTVAPDMDMGEADEEDDALQMALAMSMSQETKEPASESPAAAMPAAAPSAAMFQDADFLQSVLSSLPGVDPSDPRIQSVLSALPAKPEGGKEEEKKE